MESLFRYVAAPGRCGYLPEQIWSLEYDYVAAISDVEYLALLKAGWRHFGPMLFRPRCPACTKCRSLRVRAAEFRPDRSQRRVRKANEGDVELRVGAPAVSREKLLLYDRFHAFQSDHRGWPQHPAKDAESYVDAFVNNPVPVEEWCYYVDGRLVGVGYVDVLPGALSAIYFFYEPDERHRSLGTWNILSTIDRAARDGLPHLYLGYYVEGCVSMAYKPRFRPNELLGGDGDWHEFLD
jgi:arginine-tRNA-protein transferase